VGKMGYMYNPHKFWSSVARIKGIKAELLKFPPSIRRDIQHIVYRAMEATRTACLATIDQREFPRNNYERNMETDREFLKGIVNSFVVSGEYIEIGK
jgi:hypothetical protein